jgi:hypothetical protein
MKIKQVIEEMEKLDYDIEEFIRNWKPREGHDCKNPEEMSKGCEVYYDGAVYCRHMMKAIDRKFGKRKRWLLEEVERIK